MTKQLLILRKWWAILLEGILLILFSVFIFKNPGEVITALALWLGIAVVVAGLIGIFMWNSDTKKERDYMILIASILAFTLGLLMVFNVISILKILTVIFGLWCLLTGVLLIKHGWLLKNNNNLGLVMVIVGILAIVAALFIMFNASFGAVVLGTYLGLQVLFTGIALILLSVAKKMDSNPVK